MEEKSIYELLQIVGAEKERDYLTLSPHDQRIVRAVEEKRLTNLEAGTLQRFASASPQRQRKRVRDAKPVSAESFEKLRAELEAASARLRERHPELRHDDES